MTAITPAEPWTVKPPGIVSFTAYIRSAPTFDLVSLFTAALLCFYAGSDWYISVPIRAICLLAIFFSSIRSDPRFWCACVSLLGAYNFVNWEVIDNHKYLMWYWTVGIFGVSLLTPDKRDQAIALLGRLLIGLCFFFAVVAKLLSGEFLQGDFFYFTILEDSRFAPVAFLIADLQVAEVHGYVAGLTDLKMDFLYGIDLESVSVPDSDLLVQICQFMTVWTLLIESLIAVAFLWPGSWRWLMYIRAGSILVFMLSTYSIALVSGFAWLLGVMALAQVARDFGRGRVIFIFFLCIVVEVFKLPYFEVYYFFFGHG